MVRPGPYELRVQYESSENGSSETSKVTGPAWQLVAPMRHSFFLGGGWRVWSFFFGLLKVK